MPTPHVHAELIKQWADDPSMKIWDWNIHTNEWESVNLACLFYSPEYAYALGDKPTSPPRKMCELAGVKFPMPETKAPRSCGEYWVADPSGTEGYEWNDDDADKNWLDARIIHLTPEAAEAHSRALIAATKAAMEAAKMTDVFTDVVYKVGGVGEPPITVMPCPDLPEEFIRICTITKEEKDYWGDLDVSMSKAVAAALGKALLEAAK